MNGIINDESVKAFINAKMKKRKELLSKHKYAKTKSAKTGVWSTYLPDDTKPNHRRKIKRQTEYELDEAIIEFYDDKPHKPKTFEEAYNAWRKIHDEGVCSNTIYRYNTDRMRFFDGTDFIKLKISEITEDEICAFINKTIKEQKLCKSASKKLFEYIHDTLLYLARHEFIPKDPMQFMRESEFYSRCYTSKRSLKNPLIKNNDLSLLVKQMRKDQKNNPSYMPPYAMEFALLTGCRVGEISALRWEDISKDSIQLSASEKYDRIQKEYQIGEIKNKVERTLALTDELDDLFKRIKKQQMKDGTLSEWVFSDADGRVHANTISCYVRNKCTQAKVEYHGVHGIRKTFNSKMRLNGVSGKTAATILGNTEAVNEKYYSFDMSDISEKAQIMKGASLLAIGE